MAVDATFEFEKRRNRPVKYDRNLTGETVTAMQKVVAIQSAREQRFFAARQQDAAVTKKVQARAEIEQSIELLAPAVANRETVMRNVVDAARARIAARKKNAGHKVLINKPATSAGGGDHQDMEE